MEQKRLIAIGIEGLPPELQLSSGIFWHSEGPTRGAVLIGLGGRHEDDAENALHLALVLRSPERRLAVSEIVVTIAGKILSLDWNKEFEVHIRKSIDGEIIVSPPLANVYQRLFLFEEVEEGRSSSFYLRSERTRPTRVRGVRHTLTPLIGREKEIQSLIDLADQVTVDQGQIAGIIGEAGIGKSRLAAELKTRLKAKKFPVAEGAFLLRAEGKPYVAFRAMVLQLAEGKIETLSRWDMTDTETDFLRLLIEPETKISRFADLTDEQITQGLFQAVRKFIHAAARNPLVIVLEDVHWADEASLNLIENVMGGMEKTKLLLVLIHRPDIEKPWKNRLNYSEFELLPLNEKEIDRLIAHALDVDRVAVGMRSELAKTSLGNPLFVEELLRSLMDRKLLEVETADDGTRGVTAKGVPVKSLPTTLHSLIASRLDRLDKINLEALRWASLLGVLFEAEEWEGLVAKELKTSPSSFGTLLFQNSYLVEQSVFPRRLNQFPHELVFQVVHESLAPEERQIRHAKIGAFLVDRYGLKAEQLPTPIADHFLLGNDSSNAFLWGTRAGAYHFERFSYSSATHYLSEALQHWQKILEDPPPSHEAYELLSRSLIQQGLFSNSAAVLDNWGRDSRGKGADSEGRRYLVLAEYHRGLNEYEKSLDSANRALPLLAHAPDESRLLALEHRLHALVFLGRGREVIHEGLKAMRDLRHTRSPAAEFRIWGRMAYEAFNVTGDAEEAFHYLQKAAALESDHFSPSARIDFHRRYASAHEHVADFDEAIREYDMAIRISRDSGMRARSFQTEIDRVGALTIIGRYHEALGAAENALVEVAVLKLKQLESAAIFNIADIYLDLGVTVKAQEFLETSMKRCEGTTIWTQEYSAVLHAELLNLRGEYPEAVRLLEASSLLYEETGNDNLAVWRGARALVAGCQIAPEIQTIVTKFEKLKTKAKRLKSIRTKWWIWLASVAVAAGGGKPSDFDPSLVDPRTIRVCWLQQLAYVALIRYYRFIGEIGKAKSFLEEYRALRQTLLQNVPPEYHAAFLNHPTLSADQKDLVF